MSDKDRHKKDGQNKDKKNKRMREEIAERAQQDLSLRAQHKHEAKMTDTIPKGEGRKRLSSKERKQKAAGA
ncbi:MAG: hypothetical protein ACRD8U_19860 [Pyrinomonadaceae bacterium]